MIFYVILLGYTQLPRKLDLQVSKIQAEAYSTAIKIICQLFQAKCTGELRRDTPTVTQP